MATRRILMSALLLLPLCVFAKRGQPLQQIPPVYHAIAAAARVPAESLYSLALTESSRRLPYGERPWPWTINVAGKGYRFKTREAAWQALLQFIRKYPLKRIDVGIAQVNLGWNGHLFASFYDAFDPYTNLRVAANILRTCYDASPGSWIKAAGCYHHPAGGKAAATYIAIVRRKLDTLAPAQLATSGSQALMPTPLNGVALVSNQLTWIEPK
ncbi:lytic transglycosylase domain-containing protein [Prodigiosinella confusarubida]|uniref:Lytic transglycosylase domain-containing protein n=1 Tax=Serratia sp. (strain ATCC 39006) TaxID=104623 RepID=A0A2I5TNR9_SERS3|nr:transglycosylase SLT domain-containing protein [Serratia sp. ATCC 39006]AUH01891.1 lytic transglycosylase domain-containing protein [Serratia sp. ATCC 39006]AUH06213.1 lytic transglycosylase domain-containing protein [Serratia sp. ATCC 39006]